MNRNHCFYRNNCQSCIWIA